MKNISDVVDAFVNTMENKVVDFATLAQAEKEVMRQNNLLLKKIKSGDMLTSMSINFNFEVDGVRYTTFGKVYYITKNEEEAEYTIIDSENCLVHGSRRCREHVQGNWHWANNYFAPVNYWDKSLEEWFYYHK